MRRGLFILCICAVLMGAGLGLLALGSIDSLPGRPRIDAGNFAGASLLLLGGCVAALGIGVVHRAYRRVIVALEQMQGSGVLSPIGEGHPDVRPLTKAINGLVGLAQQAVKRAEIRAKEMEIRLKVVSAERQHLEAIIYSISDAVVVTDPFDELVLANDSAARTFNFDLASSARSPVQDLLGDSTMVGLIREMRQSRSRGGRRILEHSMRSEGGGERTYKLTLSCIQSPQEEPAGVVMVLHDMTREREVAKMKNDFVSNVSHELRTPLASIKAYAEMLIDGEAADEKTAQEFYEVIHNEANRLGRLIDNILNISRIESGLVKINKQPQSLTVLLKEAIEVISPQAKQKQITLEEQVSPAFYQTLADRDMLYEATLNLMSNAVKYTPEGGKITVATLVDEAKKTVAVRISDTGVGIPPKDLPFVFDKFYRSEANNRMAKGTGLGLSLVKHIIETVHHGRIFVESHVGEGSTFGFELDLIE